MPEKTTETGRKYEIDGKKFTWFVLDENDQPSDVTVTIPLRLKLKVLRSMAGREMDAEVMFDILAAIIPAQTEILDEMDISADFVPMFETWQSEYNALTGATLGE